MKDDSLFLLSVVPSIYSLTRSFIFSTISAALDPINSKPVCLSLASKFFSCTSVNGLLSSTSPKITFVKGICNPRRMSCRELIHLGHTMFLIRILTGSAFFIRIFKDTVYKNLAFLIQLISTIYVVIRNKPYLAAYMNPRYSLNKCAAYILIFFFGVTCSAQNFVKGTVTDSSGNPISYCAMALINSKDSSIVKGNVSNEAGEFIFEKVLMGNYRIKFSSVGYETAFSESFAVDSLSQITLETQKLGASGIALKEVAVTVIKPTIEFKQGAIIMNIENNILSGGNTVFELLKRVPGVSIDAQNNIMVNGRGGIRFMLDGRLQQIPASQMVNMLMGMPAESVSYIELIKNPPAKYDAAGTGGLINIVLKKAKVKGLNGSISQSGSHGDQWRGGTFGSLNYKNNKLTVFSNFSVSYLHFETNNYYLRNIADTNGTFQVLSQGRQDPLRNIFYMNAGIEYEVNTKTIIGITANGGPSQNNNQENAEVAIQSPVPNPYNYVKFNIASKQKYFSPSVNFTATHKFDTLTSLQFSADYTNFSESSSRFTTNHYLDNSRTEILPVNKFGSDVNNNVDIYTQKLDVNRDFKNSFKLEAGAKASFANTLANSVVYFTDPTTLQLYADSNYSNKYKYQERILAGYFTLGKNFRKLELRAGLRGEHTLADGKNIGKTFVLHRDYSNLFPSGSADLKLNERNSLQASYTYRIGRPGYDQMNPARNFNDQFSNGAGNPQLKPQYSHVMNVDYNYNNFITTSLSYQGVDNFIYYYSYGDPKTHVTRDTIFNFGTINDAVLSVFVQKQIKWFNMNAYLGGVYRDNQSMVQNQSFHIKSYLYNANCTFEFILPKNFKIQLQGFYNSISVHGFQTYFPMGVANFTVFKSFPKPKIDVSLSLFDAFYTERQPYVNQVSGLYAFYTERNDTRRIRAFIIWKFGKMRISSRMRKSNEEESDRLKKVN